MDVSAAGSSGINYSIAQQLQQLSNQTTSSILSGLPAADSATQAATQSMLMHTAAPSLAPLIANPSLLSNVIQYRLANGPAASTDQTDAKNSAAKKAADAPYDASKDPGNSAYWDKIDAASYKQFNAKITPPVGGTVDTSA